MVLLQSFSLFREVFAFLEKMRPVIPSSLDMKKKPQRMFTSSDKLHLIFLFQIPERMTRKD